MDRTGFRARIRTVSILLLTALLAVWASVSLALVNPSPAGAQTGTIGVPEIVAPSPGSPLPGPAATFAVDLNGVALQSSWYLIGSTPGGTEYGQIYVGQATSVAITGLPVDGSTVHVRYIYKTGGSWFTVDQTWAAQSGAVPEIISPAPSSVLPGSSAAFTVDLNGVPLQSSWYFIGSTPGGNEYGQIYVGQATSAAITGLPIDGSTVHVQYIYKTGGSWFSVWETYTASTGPTPQITSPLPGAVLSGDTATFLVNVNGVPLQSSWFLIGSTPGGNEYGQTWAGTGSSTTIGGLPTNGSTIHVTYLYKVAGNWFSVSESWTTAGGGPEFIQPIPGQVLLNNHPILRVDLDGLTVDSSWWKLGSTPGGSEHALTHGGASNSTSMFLNTSGLPTDSSIVHATFQYSVGGTWSSIATTFIAPDPASPLAPPLNLHSSSSTATTATISWTSPDDDPRRTGYRFVAQWYPAGLVTAEISDPTATSFTFTDLPPDTVLYSIQMNATGDPNATWFQDRYYSDYRSTQATTLPQ